MTVGRVLILCIVASGVCISAPACIPADLCQNSDSSCNSFALYALYGIQSQAAPCNPCRVFFTNATTTGGVGGKVGADAFCMADTARPFVATFKALLVDPTNRKACSTGLCSGDPAEHVDWVMYANTQYLRSPDGLSIGVTDAVGLLTAQSAPIATAAQNAWLGMFTNWIPNPGNNCTGWTDGTGGVSGANKDLSATGLDNTINNACSNTFALLCVQQ
ncbi:MAG: DUF1554 domain-containing protein [Leptospirales bacterium]|nr:DUF1554 domain-containing protein [Leptospirales bacterium]